MEIRVFDKMNSYEEAVLRVVDSNTNILFANLEDLPVCLNTVEIETINRCNNDCSFCPVSVGNEQRTMIKMSDELFYKIIDDLSEMNYSGYISIFSNNEPLIDNRIYDFVKYASEKCPDAIHTLFTNGILLTDYGFKNLISYLDLLFIDNYNDDLQMSDNIFKIVNNYDVSDNECEVIVLVRKKNEVLLNRGGLSPNKIINDSYKYSSPCILPLIQMVVRADGKISRCCQDAYGNTTLGDLSVQSVCEAFSGSEYTRYRNMLMGGTREKIPFCNVCDEFGLINYYPKQWNKLFIDSFVKTVKHKADRRKIKYLNFDDKYILRKLKDRIGDSSDYDCNDDNAFFVVLDYDITIIQELEDSNLILGEDYLVCERKWFDVGEKVCKHQYKEARRRINKSIIDGHCVVFGVGGLCNRIMNEYRLDVDYFIDNFVEDSFMDKEIIALEKLIPDENTWYILAMKDYQMPYDQLISKGVPRDKIIIGLHLYIE